MIRLLSNVKELIQSIFYIISVPAIIYTGWNFSEEIIDLYTEPSIEIELEGITFRCFRNISRYLPANTSEMTLENIQIESCLISPLVFSFSGILKNRDKVARTISGIEVVAKFPKDSPIRPTIKYDFEWITENFVENSVEKTINKPWSVVRIDPLSDVFIEVLLSETIIGKYTKQWRDFDSWVRDIYENGIEKEIHIEIFYTAAGLDRKSLILECRYILNKDSLERYIESSFPIQITQRCRS